MSESYDGELVDRRGVDICSGSTVTEKTWLFPKACLEDERLLYLDVVAYFVVSNRAIVKSRGYLALAFYWIYLD